MIDARIELRLPQPALTQVQIRQGPGVGGIGWFAAGVINRGTIILREAPLFSLRHRFTNGELAREIGLLSQANRDAFRNLHPQNGTDRQIFESNRVEIREGYVVSNRIHDSGLFLQASRFNHSCISNAHMQWNEATQSVTVYAVRRINKNSEIFVNDVAEHFAGRAKRQNALADYGFTCSCEACRGNTKFGKESEARRNEMYKLNSDVENAAMDDEPVFKEHEADAKGLLQALDLERLVFPGVAELCIERSKRFGEEFRKIISLAMALKSETIPELQGSALAEARKGLGFALMTTGPDSKVTREASDAIEVAQHLSGTGPGRQFCWHY